ncbi:MAG: DegT/DnrJ/EryC1/StrS family aminotransferase [Phycisphaerales bacterium]|nr:DegT/DnrJ/EryC1/StrS family aminotransferase [Phycisphaerales bacterium]
MPATAADLFVPVCEPLLDGREREYVLDCLDGNWVSSLGKYIPLFEERFAAYCGAAHGVACSTGTAALHLALEALGIGPGDEVIIPDFTLIVSANAVCWTGATPVPVDVDRETGCIDPQQIARAITPRTRAIMVVHMYGHPADMEAILTIARRHDLRIIEDAAQAHGAEVFGRRVGAIGDVGAFSFYGNKIITTGEGGMLVTNDPAIAGRAALLRNQAFEQERFVHRAVGYNYRMTNIQAAIGLAQCETIDEKVARKIAIARRYDELLADCDDLITPICRRWAKNVYWMYGVRVKDSFGCSAAEVRRQLEQRGVETRAFFVPMHRQPVYQGQHPRWPALGGDFPVSDEWSQTGLYLPGGLSLTNEMQCHVIQQLLNCRRSA